MVTQVTKWQASDGAYFDTEKAALDHEVISKQVYEFALFIYENSSNILLGDAYDLAKDLMRHYYIQKKE